MPIYNGGRWFRKDLVWTSARHWFRERRYPAPFGLQVPDCVRSRVWFSVGDGGEEGGPIRSGVLRCILCLLPR